MCVRVRACARVCVHVCVCTDEGREVETFYKVLIFYEF